MRLFQTSSTASSLFVVLSAASIFSLVSSSPFLTLRDSGCSTNYQLCEVSSEKFCCPSSTTCGDEYGHCISSSSSSDAASTVASTTEKSETTTDAAATKTVTTSADSTPTTTKQSSTIAPTTSSETSTSSTSSSTTPSSTSTQSTTSNASSSSATSASAAVSTTAASSSTLSSSKTSSTTSSQPASRTSSTSTPSASSTPSERAFSTRLIIGVAVAGGAAAIILAIVFYCCHKQRKRGRELLAAYEAPERQPYTPVVLPKSRSRSTLIPPTSSHSDSPSELMSQAPQTSSGPLEESRGSIQPPMAVYQNPRASSASHVAPLGVSTPRSPSVATASQPEHIPLTPMSSQPSQRLTTPPRSPTEPAPRASPRTGSASPAAGENGNGGHGFDFSFNQGLPSPRVGPAR
ncbi:hypothetical protein RUND412_004170 [Rhizina undulata]